MSRYMDTMIQQPAAIGIQPLLSVAAIELDSNRAATSTAGTQDLYGGVVRTTSDRRGLGRSRGQLSPASIQGSEITWHR